MLKAAVIGCGRMGAEPARRLEGLVPAGWLPMSHAECLRAVEGVELVALADTDTERLTRHGAYYGVQALYTDYTRLLAEVRPDVVTIATRTPVKAEIVRCACKHGAKALYVEKPFANSLAECRSALAAAAAAGTVVGYGVNRRYHSVYRHAREMVDGGEIGEVVEITAEFGRSQLLWTHPHAADLILYFARTANAAAAQASLAAATVVYDGKKSIDSDPVIEHAYFLLDSGVTATIGATGGCTLRIGGGGGTLTIHADGSYIQLSKARGQRAYFLDQSFLNAPPAASATLVALGELVAAIDDRERLPIQPAEIEGGLQMLLACAWSHVGGGRRVSAADVPADLVVTGRYHEMFA